MFNHARTILLNIDGTNSPGPSFPGEELVPSDYFAFPFSPVIERLRRFLFGASPDRAMLNYRLHQYMTILHSTELEEHVLAMDPRVTYWPPRRQDLFHPTRPTITQTHGTPAALYVSGEAQSNESLGKLLSQWRLEVLDSTRVSVILDTFPGGFAEVSYATADALGGPVTLLNSALTVSFSPQVGAVWSIDSLARPGKDLGEIANTIAASVPEQDLDYLFGVSPEEPYRTFNNLWLTHEWLPYRLGGLVLAVAYRSEEERSAHR